MSTRTDPHAISSMDRLEHELRSAFEARDRVRRQRQRRVRDALRAMVTGGEFRRCSHGTRSRLAWLLREMDAVVMAEDA